jgi:hypothetical protein
MGKGKGDAEKLLTPDGLNTNKGVCLSFEFQLC